MRRRAKKRPAGTAHCLEHMQTAFYYLATVATFAVLVVLCFGLYALLSQKSANLSQQLMRWRVGLQFLAILLIIGFVLASH
jgi:Hypoxia induced protein conserved region